MQIRTFNHHTYHSGYEGKRGGIHPYFELLYVTEGNAILEWIGNEYQVSAPNLFLLPPNTPHRLTNFRTPFSYWYIEIDIGAEDETPDIEHSLQWNRLQQSAAYESNELRLIKLTLDSICISLGLKQSGSRQFDEKVLLLDIRKIILLIQNDLHNRLHTDSGSTVKSNSDFIQILMRYMESNYFESIDLTTLSNKVHLATSYLLRSFKHETGTTPMQYLNRLRLSAAISYLANTEMSVQQISEATGFNSIHYFSRQFKRKYGSSPQQWRQQLRKQ